MADLLTKRTLQLVFPLAAAILVGVVANAVAQSRAPNSTASIQNSEKSRSISAQSSGRTAQSRRAIGAPALAAAPVALALEDAGPGPSSTPEPLSILLIGGALAGLYGVRRHIG